MGPRHRAAPVLAAPLRAGQCCSWANRRENAPRGRTSRRPVPPPRQRPPRPVAVPGNCVRRAIGQAPARRPAAPEKLRVARAATDTRAGPASRRTQRSQSRSQRRATGLPAGTQSPRRCRCTAAGRRPQPGQSGAVSERTTLSPAARPRPGLPAGSRTGRRAAVRAAARAASPARAAAGTTPDRAGRVCRG